LLAILNKAAEHMTHTASMERKERMMMRTLSPSWLILNSPLMYFSQTKTEVTVKSYHTG
jgi:hypothetical protein